MLAAERRDAILTALRATNRVSVVALTRELAVSHDTIRRDLLELEEMGLVRRVHGGALLPNTNPVPHQARTQVASAAKRAIAGAVVNVLRPEMVVYIDGGTTALAVAEQVPEGLPITVVTASLPVAMALAPKQRTQVVVLGGPLDRARLLTAGAAVREQLQTVLVDIAVIGACSVHPNLGVTDMDYDETFLKRAVIERASEVVLAVNADKLGTTAPFTVCPVTEISHLVTDAAADDAKLAAFRRAGIDVLRA